MSKDLLFARVRDVYPPKRAHEGDAGIDFFVPNDFEHIMLKPGDRALIPSGIKVAVPYGWMLIFENKSGVASKLGLTRLACVVDYGYQGEVHLSVVNTGKSDVLLAPGMKLLQGILVPVGLHQAVEVSESELYAESSDRGEGGFGSTGS